MKPLKMLGLAALTALTAMMLVGVSSAMAQNTVLCKVDEPELTCKLENQIKHVHEVTAAGAPAVLLTNIGTVECDVLFLGEVLGLGAPQIIHGNFTYTNCKRGAENCTVKETKADPSLLGKIEGLLGIGTESLLKVLKTAKELAEVTGEGEVKVKCGFFIDCVYKGEGLRGHGLGALISKALKGETTLEDQEVKKVKGICPETAKLDILTTPLEHTYIRE